MLTVFVNWHGNRNFCKAAFGGYLQSSVWFHWEPPEAQKGLIGLDFRREYPIAS